MLSKWKEGPGRTCEIIKTFQKGKSKEYVAIVVTNEYKEVVCYQTSVVKQCCEERDFDIKILDPYYSRPTYPDKESAINFCKEQVKKERDGLK